MRYTNPLLLYFTHSAVGHDKVSIPPASHSVLVVPRFQTDTPTVVVPLLWLRHVLVVPRFQTDTYGRHAFTVARPMTWNLFCDYLRNLDLSIDSLPTHPQDVCVLTMCHALSALEALCTIQICIYIYHP